MAEKYVLVSRERLFTSIAEQKFPERKMSFIEKGNTSLWSKALTGHTCSLNIALGGMVPHITDSQWRHPNNYHIINIIT